MTSVMFQSVLHDTMNLHTLNPWAGAGAVAGAIAVAFEAVTGAGASAPTVSAAAGAIAVTVPVMSSLCHGNVVIMSS